MGKSMDVDCGHHTRGRTLRVWRLFRPGQVDIHCGKKDPHWMSTWCMLNLMRHMPSHWCEVEVWREVSRLKCCPCSSDHGTKLRDLFLSSPSIASKHGVNI
ncbi:hypothetical protein AVEN_253539-1 [Araneus ventricosus]|uniref:Uncharacterized protein n=1 Tax=Araneus ventricosus TaxID=182803 RepID=A0A4Y2BSM6_ARAVE|nr:hypothetical protein AVEN_253539-1 [Araneus ventricosus]